MTYNARIDASFNGTFSLSFDSNIGYTNHARYLKDITLLGTNNNKVVVNELDNFITGNSGMNTVILHGNRTDYTIQSSGSITMVQDSSTTRNGNNQLQNIEFLQFNDEIVDITP